MLATQATEKFCEGCGNYILSLIIGQRFYCKGYAHLYLYSLCTIWSNNTLGTCFTLSIKHTNEMKWILFWAQRYSRKSRSIFEFCDKILTLDPEYPGIPREPRSPDPPYKQTSKQTNKQSLQVDFFFAPENTKHEVLPILHLINVYMSSQFYKTKILDEQDHCTYNRVTEVLTPKLQFWGGMQPSKMHV